MRPHWAATMSDRAARTQRKVPVRLTARYRFHSSRVILSNRVNPAMAALVTSTSTGPYSARTEANPASTADSSDTSTHNAMDVAPVAPISATTLSAASPSTSITATRWPSSASFTLIDRPSPDPPPVTTAVRVTSHHSSTV